MRAKPTTVKEDGSAEGRGGVAYVIESGALRVRDMPERLRPREEMARLGVRNVGDDVLLAVILRSGMQGKNVLTLARQLLEEFGSLTALAMASEDELMRVGGMGDVKAKTLQAALDIGRRLTQEAAPPRVRVVTPEDAARLLREEVRALDREVFWVLVMDAKNRLKGRPVDVTQGLLDASLVHPREVFQEAIRSGAAAVVLVHNHPSGDATPSAEDVRVTRQLIEAGRIVDIKVLDHVILGKPPADGGKDFLSMREQGIVPFA
jgi:DNA repair protein RadC